MESLKLSDNLRSSMRALYEEEFEKTLRRLEHLESVLRQLGGGSSKSSEGGAKRGRTKVSVAKTAVKKAVKRGRKSTGRRGPKPKWEGIVLGRLNAANRPITYEELINDIMAFTKTDSSRKTQLRQSVLNVVFRLRKNNNIKTVSSGTRVKYLALSNWFDNGTLKAEYKKGIKPVAVKSRKTKKSSAKKKANRPASKKKAGRPTKKATATKATSSVAKSAKRRGRPSKKMKMTVKKVSAPRKATRKASKPATPVVKKSVKPATKKAVTAKKVSTKKAAVKRAAAPAAPVAKKARPALKIKGATPSLKAAAKPSFKPAKKSDVKPLFGKRSAKNTIPGAPNWTDYALSFYGKLGKAAPASAVIKEAVKEFSIDKQYYSKVRIAVARCLSQMERSNGKVRRVNPEGSKPHAYGLGEWFVDGKLKSEFGGK